MEKLDIRKLSLEQITELIKSMGESAFRAKQIYSWIWQKSARSIDEMTNLSKSLREKLNEGYEIRCIKVDTVQYSDDGTIDIPYVFHLR